MTVRCPSLPVTTASDASPKAPTAAIESNGVGTLSNSKSKSVGLPPERESVTTLKVRMADQP
ncbi:hypothetical protein PLANTIT3_61536 [Plantibacter sp. T3]|nr:hypothetical protein PLANTIT3_61536 [Plantibacter sp. T3]